MKREWRKLEKHLYLPKEKPQFIEVPEFNFFVIRGRGNPNDDFFAEYVSALYAVSYAVRMSYKTDNPLPNYYNYTVYPLEGVWSLTEEAQLIEGKLDKSKLVFDLMIRQPDFVTEIFVPDIIARTKKKKPNPLLDKIEFKTITEGDCVQMLHKGSYDNEPASFAVMEKYCAENGLKRSTKDHREIYLSDPRKTETDKLKTVLRFQVDKNAE